MSETTPGEAGAKAVFVRVASDLLESDEYSILSSACDTQILDRIVGLAYRTQFEEERWVFKKDIREIQENVARRMIVAGEGD